MTNFERKRERCEALGKAYQSVIETRNCLSEHSSKYSKTSGRWKFGNSMGHFNRSYANDWGNVIKRFTWNIKTEKEKNNDSYFCK